VWCSHHLFLSERKKKGKGRGEEHEAEATKIKAPINSHRKKGKKEGGKRVRCPHYYISPLSSKGGEKRKEKRRKSKGIGSILPACLTLLSSFEKEKGGKGREGGGRGWGGERKTDALHPVFDVEAAWPKKERKKERKEMETATEG